MSIQLQTKKEIAASLSHFICIQGSEVKAAAAIDVSNATVNKVNKGIFDSISDAMFRKIARGIGHNMAFHAETVPYKWLVGGFEQARVYHQVLAMHCKEGSGKTYTLDRYRTRTQNVFYFKCHRQTTPRELIYGLLFSMGHKAMRGNIAELKRYLSAAIVMLENPVFIIDELEKTKNEILYETIDLYNILEGRAGIVYLGTAYLKARIEAGVRKHNMCFPEIYSRFGGNIIAVPAPSNADAELFIRGNGITDPTRVSHIVNGSKNLFDEIDMRRVDRMVHAEILKTAQDKELQLA